jgi:hypothetical protein
LMEVLNFRWSIAKVDNSSQWYGTFTLVGWGDGRWCGDASVTEHDSKIIDLDSIQGISRPYIWTNCIRPGSDIGLERVRSPSRKK